MNQTAPYMGPIFITLDASSFPQEGPWRVIVQSLVPLGMFTVLLNLGVLGACVMRRFDKPMVFYIALCVITDALWVCVLIATFVRGLLAVKRRIYFTECLIHVYSIDCVGFSQFFIQWLMDIDRYWAILRPYSYAVWTAKRKGMVFLALGVIGTTITIIMSHPIFALYFYFCNNELTISEAFCMMGFLFNIACGGKTVANITILIIAYSVYILSTITIIFTSWRIISLCRNSSSSTFSNKALHTCCTQIMVFVLKVGSRMAFVISVRLRDHSVSFRLILYILCMFTSPIADPLIYGLRTKEIRSPLTRLYRRWNKHYFFKFDIWKVKHCLVGPQHPEKRSSLTK
uniref:G-protein coupled receptors family 1 profile domain-containing protein n=1 Tax=Eptatretus burgeri TaxID=7764 RepID=A0A8C4QMZ9_EPTBU